MAFDNFFKQLMRDFVVGCEIQPDVPVGKLPLKIDLVVKCPKKSAEPLTIPMLETHFAPVNLFEYKSSRDIPKKQDLAKLVGYLGLYCDQHGIGIEEISSHFSIWYLSANRPTYFNTLLQDAAIVETGMKGLYKLQLPFLCSYYLLVINDLEVIEENLPLLLLASGETLKNTIRLIDRIKRVLDLKLEKYLSLVYFMNYEDVREMTEIQSLLPDHIKRNIKLAIEDLGLEEVIKAVGLERIVEAAGLEKMVEAVGLEKMVEAVGLEKMEKILQKLRKTTNEK
jgi:hypothetical protein